ncbi:MAG: hypothetical protein IKL13_01090 [Clostridia bacterium]|nr:hypothetical protein [Clostridia bacterium]
MKRNCIVWLLVVAVLLSGCSAHRSAKKPNDHYTVGFASVEIPLPEDSDQPLYIAGYHQGWEATGVLDLQRANALWLDNSSTSLLLITVDCIGLDGGTVAEIRSRLSDFCKETDCDSVNVISTHTHAGVDTLGLWGPIAQNGKNDAFMETLKQAAVDAAKAAYKDRSAGTLSYTATAVEGMQEDSRPPHVYDNHLYQLRFTPDDADHNGIRVISFAAHAEALRGDNTLVSRDYPGSMADTIYERTGEDVMYLPGAIGGLIMTPKLYEDPFYPIPNMTHTGKKLAMEALSAEDFRPLGTAMAVSRVPFTTHMTNTAFMYYRFLGILQNDVRRTLGGRYLLRSEVTVIRLGDVTLALMPGEVFPELVSGTGKAEDPEPYADIAARYGQEDVIFVGLANDELGYIVPPSDYRLSEDAPYFKEAEDDHYEETNSVGVNIAADLAKALEKALRKVA